MYILLAVALTFLLCFLVDKGFTKLFRSKAQHKSGMSVRLNKRFGTVGIILMVLCVAGLMASIENGLPMLIGSSIIGLVGIGLIVYYLSFGIYYDEMGFLVSGFAKKDAQYRYADIRHQMLYTLQGGSTMVELHMTNGDAVQIMSTMPEYEKFLNYAFARWCEEKGLDPEHCDFHDTQNSLWFPNVEV